MSETTGQASMAKLLGIFTLAWVAAQAALMALNYFFPNLNVRGSVSIVMVMIAAMSAGQSYARQTGRRPAGREKLVFAFLATLIAFALSVAATWGIFRYFGLPLTLENIALAATGDVSAAADIAPFLAIGAAVVGLLSLFLCWFGFGMGARNQIKQAERAAAKG
ncbi:MAG: ABZJ_00895 family protein [Paracoccaceae bacterium]